MHSEDGTVILLIYSIFDASISGLSCDPAFSVDSLFLLIATKYASLDSLGPVSIIIPYQFRRETYTS